MVLHDFTAGVPFIKIFSDKEFEVSIYLKVNYRETIHLTGCHGNQC